MQLPNYSLINTLPTSEVYLLFVDNICNQVKTSSSKIQLRA